MYPRHRAGIGIPDQAAPGEYLLRTRHRPRSSIKVGPSPRRAWPAEVSGLLTVTVLLTLALEPASAQRAAPSHAPVTSGDTAAEGSLELAARLMREGRLPEADHALTEQLAADPENAALWVARGRVRAQQRRHAQAAADFSAALRYAPDDARAYAARGEQLRLLGALPRAIEDATAAIRIDPTLAEAYAGRAYALQRLGRNEEARRDAEAALATDAHNALALLARGLARERLDPAAARGDIERAVALGLNSPVAVAALKRLGQSPQ